MSITELWMAIRELCKCICEHIQSYSEIQQIALEAIRQAAGSVPRHKADWKTKIKLCFRNGSRSNE